MHAGRLYYLIKKRFIADLGVMHVVNQARI
jgi:hypothetical protein